MTNSVFRVLGPSDTKETQRHTVQIPMTAVILTFPYTFQSYHSLSIILHVHYSDAVKNATNVQTYTTQHIYNTLHLSLSPSTT